VPQEYAVPKIWRAGACPAHTLRQHTPHFSARIARIAHCEQRLRSGKLAISSMVDLAMKRYVALTNPATYVAWPSVFLPVFE
jgi:hypothetical protein